MTHQSPIPWTVDAPDVPAPNVIIRSGSRLDPVCHCGSGTVALANGKLIVRAVNSHEGLLMCLRDLSRVMSNCLTGEAHPIAHETFGPALRAMLRQADAAIALAEKEVA